MLSKAKIKYVKSLQVKKYRKQEQCFVVEGAKSVLELLDSDFEILLVLATPGFLAGVQLQGIAEVVEVTPDVLEAAGGFQTNETALAVCRMKPNVSLPLSGDEFALVLDDIRDPGNLGTIIRTADWYGIQKIIVSEETADFYSPKTITSTMGSFVRVNIFYTNLPDFFSRYSGPVFGAYLEGKDVHSLEFGAGGLILIGNESRGISGQLDAFVTDKITIPRYGSAESLNAAIATAVICDNLRR